MPYLLNFSDSTLSASAKDSRHTADIIGYQIIPAVSFIGLCLNLLSIIVLYNPRPKRIYYEYLWGKSFWNMFICLIGVFSMNASCLICEENFKNKSRAMLLYRMIYNPNRDFLFNFSILNNVYLTFNRYCILMNKNPLLNNIRVIYVSSIMGIILTIFIVFIATSSTNKEFSFSNTTYYYYRPSNNDNLTLVLLYLCTFVIALGAIVFLSILVLCKLSASKQMNQEIRLKRSDIRFINLTLALNCIVIYTRVFEVVSFLLVLLNFKLDIFGGTVQSQSILTHIKLISLLQIILGHSLNPVIYLVMDKNLLASLRSSLQCCYRQVIIFIHDQIVIVLFELL